VFRGGDFARYEAAESWNKSEHVPIGIAAVIAFLFGALGMAMGMAQIWVSYPTIYSNLSSRRFAMMRADTDIAP
jgi:purine-cytosine permease-like protein